MSIVLRGNTLYWICAGWLRVALWGARLICGVRWRIVGMENVIASTDCGFASFAAADEIDSGIAWAKLDALVKFTQAAKK